MSTTPQDACRKAFEAEFEPRGYDMRIVPDGHNFGYYINEMTEGAWRGFQAAYNRPKAEVDTN